MTEYPPPQQQRDLPPRIKLTGLWKKTDSKGGIYLTGPLSGTSSLMVFMNNRKENENDPDYLAYVMPRKRQQQPGQHTQPSQQIMNQQFPQAQQQAAPPPVQQQQAAPAQQAQGVPDDIPF